MNKEQKRIIRVLLLLSIMFISLIVYLTYFELFRAEEVKSSSYNKRPSNDEYILRGSIYDRNKNLLASSTRDANDNQIRYYEHDNLYSHVIGYYDDIYGQTGLERAYNSTLSDSNIVDDVKNVFFQVLDRLNVSTESIPLNKDSKGNSLVLTIDHALQKLAKEQLGTKKGSIVAMNPQNGDILAMVSYPDFNPSKTKNDWKETDSEFNRATQGTYPPGSIYKIITATAALENEDINTDINCEGEINIGGTPIHDAGNRAHGNIDLTEALVQSCNVSFSQIGVQLGQDKLKDVSERFMFNEEIPFDINTKASKFPAHNMDKTELAKTSFGQGELLVTPLNMALMASAIANDGEMMTPNLVKNVINSGGTVLKESKSEVLSTVTTPEIANKITDMMVGVVDRGTGTNARINGVNVAGKTGTAEVSKDSDDDHAWFVAFAPAENPQIAVTVILENHGGSGGRNAAPIAKNIIIKALNNIKVDN